MLKLKPFALVASLAAIALVSSRAITLAQEEAEKPKPKYTIEQVMEKAHKDKLLNKVVAGDASDDEKKQLLDLYLSLPENTPPKGDAESWQKLSSQAVTAAARVVVGRDGAEKQLQRAVACAPCHKAHRPPAEN